MAKKRVVVVCPGRGSYTKETLGYLQRRGAKIQTEQIQMDHARKKLGFPTLTEMDSESVFKTQLHTKGEHASPLIYACSLADFVNIDRNQFEIVAITGNSMGWYITLALAKALDVMGGFHVIQTMGGMMSNGLVGGQIIYPLVDENWHVNEQKKRSVFEILATINEDVQSHESNHADSRPLSLNSLNNNSRSSEKERAYVSIELGGYLVIGANRSALARLLKELPPDGDFPFQLINHGAFHTPLLNEVSAKGFQMISKDLFQKPEIPMIDGRGCIWQPYSTDVEKLYRYTLGTQVVEPYSFTKAVSVALKEFAPDHLMLLGPGNSLGGSIGQIMIQNKWRDVDSKSRFSEHQKTDAKTLISLGVE